VAEGTVEDRDAGGALGRRLPIGERDALLALPVPGVFSTITADGWVHSVPVHFFYGHDEFRFIAERDSVKVGNLRRTGRATLCVVATIDTERRYVTAEGPARIEERFTEDDLSALDERYGTGTGAADDDAYGGSITVVLRPERWIAWADIDD
jgi:PPOX class probable F420-dependent enzyme